MEDLLLEVVELEERVEVEILQILMVHQVQLTQAEEAEVITIHLVDQEVMEVQESLLLEPQDQLI